MSELNLGAAQEGDTTEVDHADFVEIKRQLARMEIEAPAKGTYSNPHTLDLAGGNLILDGGKLYTQAEVDALLAATKAETARLKKLIGDLQLRATEAREHQISASDCSKESDSLYEVRDQLENPFDKRTKAYKDHEKAQDAANKAWGLYNNDLRNIGLAVTQHFQSQAE